MNSRTLAQRSTEKKCHRNAVFLGQSHDTQLSREGDPLEKAGPTQIKNSLAQTVCANFCLPVSAGSLKGKGGTRSLKANCPEIVCANCVFYLGGRFVGVKGQFHDTQIAKTLHRRPQELHVLCLNWPIVSLEVRRRSLQAFILLPALKMPGFCLKVSDSARECPRSLFSGIFFKWKFR